MSPPLLSPPPICCPPPPSAVSPPHLLFPPPNLLFPPHLPCPQAFWQSSSFVLGAAVQQFYGATICSTVTTEDGFFCDAHMGDRYRAVGALPH